MASFVDHITLNQNEIRNANIQVLNSDPGTPSEGRFYYNSVSKKLRIYNGTGWQDYAVVSEVDDALADANTYTDDQVAGLASTSYVDTAIASAVAGISWKDSVRAATTANLDLSGDETIDTVDLNNGDRVLVKDQTDAEDNGIYIVNTAGAWTRATDADSAAELRGAAVYVEEGDANEDKLFTLATDGFTLGTDPLSFTQFSTGGGGGSVDVYNNSATHSSGTSFDIDYSTHNIGGGTRNIDVAVWEVSSGTKVHPSITATSGGDVTITFGSSVSANAYRVVILG